MRKILKNLTVSLLATLLLFACGDDKYMGNYDYLNSDTEVSVTIDEETFVSLELATSVAEAFLSVEVAKKGAAKSFANASVETVKDKNNNPSMYVVNYPEGGWVIVSATRNYVPVLAFSEKGSFEIKPAAEMGGAVLWLEETKEAVRVSGFLADSTKTQMRSMWQTYETNGFKISESSGAKNYQMMEARIDQLQALYGSSGWSKFAPLEDVIDFTITAHQNLLNLANSMGSPSEFTIVGIKYDYPPIQTVGPLMSTQWGQSYPYNVLCPSQYPAGCVAVAIAQIMHRHRKPAFVSSPANHMFNWNNMPNTYTNTLTSASAIIASGLPALLSDIGINVNMQYGLNGSASNIYAAQAAFLNNYNYSAATIVSHDKFGVISQINNQRPVYMRGESTQGGHAWVCDGARQDPANVLFFVEFFTGGGYNSYGYYTPSSPGIGNSWILYYFQMNWGWNGSADGWFYENSVNPSPYNFQTNRLNLYITP